MGCVPYVWVVGAHCVSGCAFQVAQTARALHWIVKTLRASGFGSEVDVPTLGEWVARPAAGLHPPVFFWVWGQWEERQLAGLWPGGKHWLEPIPRPGGASALRNSAHPPMPVPRPRPIPDLTRFLDVHGEAWPAVP